MRAINRPFGKLQIVRPPEMSSGFDGASDRIRVPSVLKATNDIQPDLSSAQPGPIVFAKRST
jgi:hypothetical protein